MASSRGSRHHRQVIPHLGMTLAHQLQRLRRRIYLYFGVITRKVANLQPAIAMRLNYAILVNGMKLFTAWSCTSLPSSSTSSRGEAYGPSPPP